MVNAQDQEIRRLSAVVEAALNSDNRKWKQEVLDDGQSCIIYKSLYHKF